MRDICLNYATEDREKAATLAALLMEKGWTVALNEPPEAPGTWENRTARENVRFSKAVVVLWSSPARDSSFLREALSHAKGPNTIAVLLEKIEPPPDETHAAVIDLSEWDGSDPRAITPPGRSFIGRTIHKPFGKPFVRPRPVKPSVPAWYLELEDLVDGIQFLMEESAAALATPSVNPPGQDHPAAPPAQGKSAGGQGFGGVFISYRRSDAAAYARALYDRLAALFGRERVFLDVENVSWGDDFVEAITAAAESCAVMIALISPLWLRGASGQGEVDDYVRLEVATALRRKISVIPILIQGAPALKRKELPKDLAPLARHNALALSDTRWERDVEDLMQTLKGLLKD